MHNDPPKQEQAQAQAAQQVKTGAIIQSQTQTDQAKAKQKMQAILKKLVIQLKQGCKKQFCFNEFCLKNLFKPVGKNFNNDKEMLKFAIETI